MRNDTLELADRGDFPLWWPEFGFREEEISNEFSGEKDSKFDFKWEYDFLSIYYQLKQNDVL